MMLEELLKQKISDHMNKTMQESPEVFQKSIMFTENADQSIGCISRHRGMVVKSTINKPILDEEDNNTNSNNDK